MFELCYKNTNLNCVVMFVDAYINKKYICIYVHEKNEYYLSVNLGVEE